MSEEGVGDDLFEAWILLGCGPVHEVIVGGVQEGGEVVVDVVVDALEVAEFVEQGAADHEDFFTVVFGHGLEELVCDATVDVVGDGLVVVPGGPDVAQEVGGVDVAVSGEEGSVAATAEHQIGIEFAAKFGAGFGDDAGEVGEAVEFLAAVRNVTGPDFDIAENPVLFGMEVIPTGGGDEEGGGLGGYSLVDEILDEIEEFTGFVADGFEELEVLVAVVATEIAVSALVGFDTAAE